MTNDEFREIFPEFGKIAGYSDLAVDMWLALAASQMDAERWGDAYGLGIALYAAHNLVLSKRNGGPAGPGGGAAGPMVSKTIGSVSATYDIASVASAGAGEWNLTGYGQRWWRLSRLAGAGGTQL